MLNTSFISTNEAYFTRQLFNFSAQFIVEFSITTYVSLRMLWMLSVEHEIMYCICILCVNPAFGCNVK